MIISDWHINWQNNFIDYKEKTYKSENMVKSCRRADVDLLDNIIIEFQYSYISSKEVNDRKKDWSLMNKEILWIICGNDVEVTELKNSKRYFLEFTESWKYDSFTEYDFIYLDIDDKIYKINPKYVKSNMIDVQPPIDKSKFIECLKNNTYNELFQNNVIYQTNIFVKQQGAGNGKTFGIVQLLQNDDFSHYDTFVFLTKLHSAVHVIFSEIKSQIEKKLLNDIEIIDNNIVNKKHNIIFKNLKSNKKCKIIIGTFDSFIYALGNNNKPCINKFISMVNHIIDEGFKCTINGGVDYAGGIFLNKKLLLIGDEMQDLQDIYMKAIIKITRDRYVDFYGVGDKLQSITIINNAFTFLLEKELPYDTIKVTKIKPSNYCRRFNNGKLIDFINRIVDFKTFNLPEIENDKRTYEKNEGYEIFEGSVIYNSETDNNKICKEVEKIMEKYIYEVEKNNYKPNDFLIVTPFVSSNILVEFLHTSIRDFWIKKYNENKKYSVFHKSDQGSSIDLSESDDATRIVSIHTSKGDGRNVVFVLGINESALRIYSLEKDNLIYNSLLHVALTRMKKKLYFRIEQNNDDIHTKINYLNNNIKPSLNDLSINIKLDKIKQINSLNNYDLIYKNIIVNSNNKNEIKENKENNDDNKQIIDLKHHKIRYYTMCILLIIEIMNHNFDINREDTIHPFKQQIFQIWKNCLYYKIRIVNSAKEYNIILNNSDLKEIPFLIYHKDNKLNKYSDFILDKIKKIRKKLSTFINNSNLNKNAFIKLKPLESIILYYLMEIIDQREYSDFSINDLYDVIDYYKSKSNGEKNKNKFIKNHYQKLTDVGNLFKNIINKYPNLLWLINYKFSYKSKNEDFYIYSKHKFIAYNNENVCLFYLKPQFNSLNYNEIMYDSIYDSYLLINTEKFTNKKISSCVISFDNDKPYYFNWYLNDKNLLIENQEIIKSIIKNNLNHYWQIKFMNLFNYYTYHINNTKNNNFTPTFNEIIRELESIENMPLFIKNIFNNIKLFYKMNKENPIEYIKKLCTNKGFRELFNSELDESIDNFI